MAKVLVTGAAGFLGGAVCRTAAERGDSVLGIVREGELGERIPGVAYRTIDWSHSASIAWQIAQHGPDAVVHCAGATPRLSTSSADLYEANVGLTWKLLAAATLSELRPALVVVSSAAVYGAGAPTPIAEDAPVLPANHYGWSKAVAEDVVRGFVELDGTRACIARPFNILGLGEPEGSVVSDVVRQLSRVPRPGSVTVRETESVRDFIDVDDVARALLAIGDGGKPGEAYNVCTGHGTSVAELIEIAQGVWDSSATVVASHPDSEPSVSIGSNERLRALGWEPRMSIADSLARLRDAAGS